MKCCFIGCSIKALQFWVEGSRYFCPPVIRQKPSFQCFYSLKLDICLSKHSSESGSGNPIQSVSIDLKFPDCSWWAWTCNREESADDWEENQWHQVKSLFGTKTQLLKNCLWQSESKIQKFCNREWKMKNNSISPLSNNQHFNIFYAMCFISVYIFLFYDLCCSFIVLFAGPRPQCCSRSQEWVFERHQHHIDFLMSSAQICKQNCWRTLLSTSLQIQTPGDIYILFIFTVDTEV